MKQLILLNRYRPGLEAHDDPDRMELVGFFGDDEPPKGPYFEIAKINQNISWIMQMEDHVE